MSKFSDFFLHAFDCQREGRIVPYYIEGKIRDLHQHLSFEEQSIVVSNIVRNDHAGLCFRYLNNFKALSNILTPLAQLHKVPQDKGKSRNALDHTLRVLDKIPVENINLRWVALFHDLGKYDSYKRDKNFFCHASYSADITKLLCKIYELYHSDMIINVVKNHMFPLDYQRQPNWTDSAVKKFIERCSGYAVQTVEFSIYDKKAEHNNEEYLKPLIELRERIIDVSSN